VKHIVVVNVARPGVSNLFDRRAKCTNFKLVGGQTTFGAEIEMPKAVEGAREWGEGVPLPS